MQSCKYRNGHGILLGLLLFLLCGTVDGNDRDKLCNIYYSEPQAFRNAVTWGSICPNGDLNDLGPGYVKTSGSSSELGLP